MCWKQMQSLFLRLFLEAKNFMCSGKVYIILGGSQWASLTTNPSGRPLFFFFSYEFRFYIEEIMYNNYKLLRFLFETYGWTLILKNQSILFPKNVLRQVFCFFCVFFPSEKTNQVSTTL